MPRLRFTVLALGLLALAGCEKPSTPEYSAAEAKPVQVITTVAEPLELFAELPGRLEPVRVAEVRARVAGVVLHQQFKEGADVKAGDLLFQIDPAPLRAALAQAQGALARAQAQVVEGRAKLGRYQALAEVQAISRQDLDSARATLASGQADVQSAQAQVQTAQLNLGYASVRAPIAGRIGRALVTEGALVGQGEATLLARIQQLDPIYADFSQPAADALRLRQGLEDGSLGSAAGQPLSLQVDGLTRRAEGTLLFTDVSVERQTGQLALRGRFANPDKWLLPGMYVRVRAPQGLERSAVLVPQRAVQRDQAGQARVLLLVNGKVEARPVSTGVMRDGRWQVTEGLAPGQQVIVGGPAGLNPGDAVQVAEPAAAPAAAKATAQ